MKPVITPRHLELAAPRPDSQRAVWGVCLFLVVAVFLVFGQTLRHEFVNYDDNEYFSTNPQVQAGLTWNSVVWAFRTGYVSNWNPLTWLSFMLDVELYGSGPAGPHLTNLLLHAANTVLLFLLLRRLTNSLWPGAFVAAIFAIHPLRVESVAWVSERKDVLSGLFFMLTLLMYARYAQGVTHGTWQMTRPEAAAAAPAVSRATRHTSLFYALSLLFFALGLMSKPMLVTLPFVLLLLDYWPVGRFSSRDMPSANLRLLLEKLPFFALSVCSCIATMLAQGETVAPTTTWPLSLRISNALVSYVTYLGQMFYPARLAVFYPLLGKNLPLWEVTLALVLLTGISVGVLALGRRRPYLVIGWLWYLGMLVPVIGLVPVGFGYQSLADRYTYLPQIGLYLAVVWTVKDLTLSWRCCRPVLSAGAFIVITALMVCASIQTSYWRNSELLWKHTLACTPDNARAHNNLGNALVPQGRLNEAIEHYQQALQINPDYAEAHNNLGNALALQGRFEEAIEQYQQAIHINPKYFKAHYDLGAALMQSGRYEEAMDHFKKALEIEPGFAIAHNNLGVTLMRIGRRDEAIIHFQKAVEIEPGYADAHYNLACFLGEKGRLDEAVEQYQTVVHIDPNNAEAHGNLANVLAAQGRLDEAAREYQRTLELAPNSVQAHFRFGQALQKQTNFATAIKEYQKTLELDPKHLPAQLGLAWLLATCPEASLRNGNRAVELARQAEGLAGGGESPQLLDTLAAAYAEAGRFGEAVATAKQALNLPATQNNQPLADAIQTRLELYETNSPYHEKP